MKENRNFLKAKKLIDKLYNEENALSQATKTRLYGEYLYLLRKAAYANYPLAQYELAQQYEDITYLSLNNPNYNPKRLVYWYTKACNGNVGDACNSLANLYESGVGCERDLKKALELYKRSGELGCDLGKRNYKTLLKQVSKGGKYEKVLNIKAKK